MQYITTFERHAKEEGITQGIQLGETKVLIRQLQHKFKFVPDSYLQQIKKADAATLLAWCERVLYSQNLEDIFKA